MAITTEELTRQLEEMRAEHDAMKIERDQMREEKDKLKELHAAQTDKPVTVDRYQMGCQPQKLPPLPHFDGKDPKKYHGFERRACAMLEANQAMTDEGRKFALRMCLTDTAADRVNELVESPEFPAMSYETTKEKFFDLLSDSSSLATCMAAYRSTTQGADETCEDYLATIRDRWLDATRKKKRPAPSCTRTWFRRQRRALRTIL